MSEQKSYKTADIALAAIFLQNQIPLQDVEQIPEKRKHEIYRFVFEDTDLVRSLVKQYISNTILVEPKQYLSNIRLIKQQIKDKVMAEAGNEPT